ncbi:MAG: hypothetical protein IT265_08290 [Saprospiraceae bacterium]|nr:hypothetical protein [Saprospiraceae bacterium]
MKLPSLIFIILNLILLSYWTIRRNTLISYVNQFSKWEVGSKLQQYKFSLSKYLYEYQLQSPVLANIQILNYNYLKLLLNINEEIDFITLNKIDSIKNQYIKQHKVISPENKFTLPNFNFKYYPPEFESILNKLIVRSIGEIAHTSSGVGRWCGIEHFNICTPYINSINKYRIFYLGSWPCDYYEGTCLVINMDTLLNPLAQSGLYKLSSPIDSTTIIYKYFHLYGEKDSLISTYKTKIIELD